MSQRILIAGAGAAGLATAHRLAGRGCVLTLVDAGEPGRGALWASGGMLAPGFETVFELEASGRVAEAFAGLARHAGEAWPDFAARIESESGQTLFYQRLGSVTPAVNDAAVSRLDDAVSRAGGLGVAVERLTARELARQEPALARAEAALRFPDDGQVDNRALAGALVEALRRSGVRIRERDALAGLDTRAGEAILASGTRFRADVVILATGASVLPGLTACTGVEPVKGQMASLAAPAGAAPRQVIRAPDIYIAAKGDGRVVIGATNEPGVGDLSTDHATIEALKHRAAAIAPGLAGAPEIERWAGLRPRVRGGAPLVAQRVDLGGSVRVITMTGGYRNGVLLAPVMAQAAAALALGETDPLWPAAFTAPMDAGS